MLCDYLYVGYSGAPFEGAASVDRIEQQAFVQQHPLGGLRRVVNEGLREGLPPVSTPGLDARPVQLHIMHFWGGGLDRWVRDFGRADPSRCEPHPAPRTASARRVASASCSIRIPRR